MIPGSRSQRKAKKSLLGYVVDSFIEDGFDAICTIDFETDIETIQEFISHEQDKVISAYLYLLKLRFQKFTELSETVCQLRKIT